MRVSGTLTPDIHGDYERADDYNGYHAWTCLDPAWSIWYDIACTSYVITPTIGVIPEAESPYWIHHEPTTEVTGVYDFQPGATGDATVTSI